MCSAAIRELCEGTSLALVSKERGPSDILHLLCRQKSSCLGHRTWIHMLSYSHLERREYPYVGGSHMSQDHAPAEM